MPKQRKTATPVQSKAEALAACSAIMSATLWAADDYCFKGRAVICGLTGINIRMQAGTRPAPTTTTAHFHHSQFIVVASLRQPALRPGGLRRNRNSWPNYYKKIPKLWHGSQFTVEGKTDSRFLTLILNQKL